jgi:membrane-associated protease RseP (regulator of RpoE activity)
MDTGAATPEEIAPVVPRPERWRDPVAGHVAAFLLTVLSTTFVGAWHWAAFAAGSETPAADPGTAGFWAGGLIFSVPVLAILGCHELGHYLACRYYDVDATLPWFLPAPLPLTGTLGAFIRLREPIPHARALFDIAVAGPLAGFVVAVPLLVAGIAGSRVVPLPADGGGLVLGDPLLFQLVERIVWGVIPDGQALYVHPMGLAAWFGLLATALNLFPFGQLDGGHITYALVGRHARWLSMATIAATLALAAGSLSWAAWTVMLLVMTAMQGVGHPPTGDDTQPLGRTRLALAVAAALVFVLSFTPRPIEPMDIIDDEPPTSVRAGVSGREPLFSNRVVAQLPAPSTQPLAASR